jgi:hypothetical protein
MSNPEDSGEERINRALGTSGLPGGGDLLRASLLAQTIGVIRRRRRLKKLVLAATLLGFYLAGMATTGLWRRVKAVPIRPPAEQMATSSPVVVGKPPLRPESSRPQPPWYVGAAERQSAPARIRGVQAMQRSADRLLLEDGDVESAVRGYNRVLDLASAKQRVISPENDTWLLMALKNAKSKELRHDRIQD